MLGIEPSKVIAVHLNYPSRAEERGRIPTEPSYFLKPPSSISGSGSPVFRPKGCELLTFEGELAIIIGKRARRVSPADAPGYIGGYTVGNDFGIEDLRWADRGSNLLSKGHDGFTPLGPRIVPAAELDAENLTIRTFVNGTLEQEDSTGGLFFPPAALIADLSRMITLERGDVILTGTPANTRPVEPGDVVTVEIEGIGSLTNPVVEDDQELSPFGAMPRVRDVDRLRANSGNGSRKRLDARTEAALRRVSTATLSVQLSRRGIRDTFLAGLRPTHPDRRLLGFAYTLRYVPLREDVRAADTAKLNAQKRAVETIGPDEVLVIEARGEKGAGTIGDILATRAQRRGAAGIVTDGALRDTAAFADIEIPTFYAASHAAVLGLRHYPLEVNTPVTCGGVLVLPGDVVVGDGDGVLVIPAAMADEVALAALEQEEREEWSLERIQQGESIRGVYPIGDERLPEFERWRQDRARKAAD